MPPLEWAAAGVGLLVALALSGILLWHALDSRGDTIPLLSVRQVGLVHSGGAHIVEFELSNRSAATAAAVQVEGVLESGGAGETSSATIDYVPGRSSARGGLAFSADPRRHRLKLRVTGYELP